jgi:hypothetical protein
MTEKVIMEVLNRDEYVFVLDCAKCKRTVKTTRIDKPSRIVELYFEPCYCGNERSEVIVHCKKKFENNAAHYWFPVRTLQRGPA